MKRESRNRQLRAAYDGFHSVLTEILYYEDPDGIGAGSGAPPDEYSFEATKLISRLRDVDTLRQVRTCVTQVFPKASEECINKVFQALREFDSASEPPGSDP